jgi:hypothetical protein
MNYWYMSAVPFSVIVPFFVGLARWKELPGYAVVMLWLLLLSGITHSTTTILAVWNVNNMPFFHVYTVLEPLLLFWFFHRLLNSPVATKYLYVLGGSFLIFAVLNTLYIQSWYYFNSYARSIEAILVMGLCLVYLQQQFRSDTISWKDPGLWLVMGLFSYFSAAFIIFIISNLSLELNKYFDWLIWNVHATILLIIYGLYTVGFVKCAR